MVVVRREVRSGRDQPRMSHFEKTLHSYCEQLARPGEAFEVSDGLTTVRQLSPMNAFRDRPPIDAMIISGRSNSDAQTGHALISIWKASSRSPLLSVQRRI